MTLAMLSETPDTRRGYGSMSPSRGAVHGLAEGMTKALWWGRRRDEDTPHTNHEESGWPSFPL